MLMLPLSKKEAIIKLCQDALSMLSVSLKEIASILGRFIGQHEPSRFHKPITVKFRTFT